MLLLEDEDEDCCKDANDVSGDRGLSGAGGGSMGEARPSIMAFFSEATSWRSALFSDLVLPSSARIASMI